VIFVYGLSATEIARLLARVQVLRVFLARSSFRWDFSAFRDSVVGRLLHLGSVHFSLVVTSFGCFHEASIVGLLRSVFRLWSI